MATPDPSRFEASIDPKKLNMGAEAAIAPSMMCGYFIRIQELNRA